MAKTLRESLDQIQEDLVVLKERVPADLKERLSCLEAKQRWMKGHMAMLGGAVGAVASWVVSLLGGSK
jgi:hypothetical protein